MNEVNVMLGDKGYQGKNRKLRHHILLWDKAFKFPLVHTH